MRVKPNDKLYCDAPRTTDAYFGIDWNPGPQTELYSEQNPCGGKCGRLRYLLEPDRRGLFAVTLCDGQKSDG